MTKQNEITENVVSSNIRNFVLSAIALGLVAWDLSFNLGVYGTIFYEKIFTVWVVCTVVLIANFCLPKKHRYLNAWGIFAMITPTFWIALEYWDYIINLDTILGFISFWLAFVIMAICLPYVAYIVIAFTQADALKLRPRRLYGALAAITLFIALVGYGLGVNHRLVLTCHDFEVAGSKVPVDCYNPNFDVDDIEDTLE